MDQEEKTPQIENLEADFSAAPVTLSESGRIARLDVAPCHGLRPSLRAGRQEARTCPPVPLAMPRRSTYPPASLL
jgi:hypothetical protein